MISLEICANSINSALAAQEGGAIRVELCNQLEAGGITPSPGQITVARKLLNIKLYVLIRPRGSDFLYNDAEFAAMLADVQYCIDAGCDGIVTGILKADGSIDTERCTQLVQLAKQAGLGATFHRAFDMCADQFQAMEDIIDVGFERILTSGGRSTAIEGSRTINELIKKAAGRISIMPGSGITEINVADLIIFTGASEIHGSAVAPVKSMMTYQNDHIVMGSGYGDEYAIDTTSVERVKNILKRANEGI
jgi:copper homeostasis protein